MSSRSLKIRKSVRFVKIHTFPPLSKLPALCIANKFEACILLEITLTISELPPFSVIPETLYREVEHC